MNTKITYAIGLMSGTSLDGLDLVYVKFAYENRYRFEILSHATVKYSDHWKGQLQCGIQLEQDALYELDLNYGAYLGTMVCEFIQNNCIERVDFIASHGHTILHRPEKGITKQIGDGQEMANVTGHRVVCDFRTQDVELGGQGAPLVPIGDRLLFSDVDACVNLGGFANISFEKEGQRIAYDLCPVNVVLNYYSEKLGQDFDAAGKLASVGKIDQNLLDRLNDLDYYSKSPPKSLGIEWVNDLIFPMLHSSENYHDILRTYAEHIAVQIARHIKDFNSVLFTGGGVFNTFLMHRIEQLVSSRIIIPDREIIDFKEALIFALLGLLKLEDRVNCLASVTGASQDHVSGKIFTPK